METTNPVEAEVIEPQTLPMAVPKTNAAMRPGVGVFFQSVAEVWSVADGLRKGGAGPKGSTTASIAASIIKGQSIGLDLVTSMSYITVVNGRASLMGDLALGLVRKSGLTNPKAGGYLREEWAGEGEARTCTMSAKRHDTGEEMVRSFSTAQARAALLIGKTAIWTGFHDRMLRYRAMGFLLRDLFSDILLGLYLTEELQASDYFTPPASGDPRVETAIQAAEPQADPFFSTPAEPEVLDASAVTVLEAPNAQEPASAPQTPAGGPIIVGDIASAAAAQGLDEATLAATADKVIAMLSAEPAPNSPEDPFRGFRDPAAAPVTIPTSARVKKRVTKAAPAPATRPAFPALPSSTVAVTRRGETSKLPW
jgi:hypothetical protein